MDQFGVGVVDGGQFIQVVMVYFYVGGYVQVDCGDWLVGGEYYVGCFGIVLDIGFGGWGDVVVDVEGVVYDYYVVYQVGDVWGLLQGQCEVGYVVDCDQGYFVWMGVDQVDDQLVGGVCVGGYVQFGWYWVVVQVVVVMDVDWLGFGGGFWLQWVIGVVCDWGGKVLGLFQVQCIVCG